MACRAIEGPGRDHFPGLFGLDAWLSVPHGQGYWLDRTGILHARLDNDGNGLYRACPHPGLTPEALWAAGLRKWYAPELRPRRRWTAGSASYRGSSLVFSFGAAHAHPEYSNIREEADLADSDEDEWSDDGDDVESGSDSEDDDECEDED